MISLLVEVAIGSFNSMIITGHSHSSTIQSSISSLSYFRIKLGRPMSGVIIGWISGVVGMQIGAPEIDSMGARGLVTVHIY